MNFANRPPDAVSGEIKRLIEASSLGSDQARKARNEVPLDHAIGVREMANNKRGFYHEEGRGLVFMHSCLNDKFVQWTLVPSVYEVTYGELGATVRQPVRCGRCKMNGRITNGIWSEA